MIDIHQLRFRYAHSGFELNIDALRIQKGEKVAVVGPSGSGKTTLLNLISGIAAVDSGKIMVDQQEVSSMSDRRRRDFRIRNIGAVFQQFELIDYLSVRENILFPFWINPTLKLDAATRQQASYFAEQVGLAGKLNRSVRTLSQGEQQRVAICRALIVRPPVILADEPTGNLDPANKTRILSLLFEQCEQLGLTLVAVTHDVNILDGFDRSIDFENFRREVKP